MHPGSRYPMAWATWAFRCCWDTQPALIGPIGRTWNSLAATNKVFWLQSASSCQGWVESANFLVCFPAQNISWPESLGPSDAVGTPNHHSLYPREDMKQFGSNKLGVLVSEECKFFSRLGWKCQICNAPWLKHWKRISDSNPDSNPFFGVTIALLSRRNCYRITIGLYILRGTQYGIAIGLLSSIDVT